MWMCGLQKVEDLDCNLIMLHFKLMALQMPCQTITRLIKLPHEDANTGKFNVDVWVWKG